MKNGNKTKWFYDTIWYFFVVECNDGSLYPCVTKDIAKTLHSWRNIKTQRNKIPRYIKGRLPIKLKFVKPLLRKKLADRCVKSFQKFNTKQKKDNILSGIKR